MSDQNLSRRALWMQKLADEVVHGLAERIRSGDLHPGACLPDRTSLAAEYITSDGVVERAIEHLMADGLVRRDDNGRVCVVGYPGPEDGFELPQSDKATLNDVLSVLELRIGIEGEAAAHAAERHTPEQLAAIRSAAAAYEAAVSDRTAPARADYQFHLSIADAAGNRYFHELVEYLGPLLIPRMRAAVLATARGTFAASTTEHQAVIDAITARDSNAARDAMQRHLGHTFERIRANETLT